MKVMLNGKEAHFEDNTTLLSMLEAKAIKPASVIVEYNHEIPGREVWDNIILKENDNIEVVKFIGGG